MNKVSAIKRFAAVLVLTTFSFGLFAQNTAPDDTSQQVILASPILLVSGVLLIATGSVLWLSTDSTNQYWIPGVSLFGGGLLSTIVGFALGGTEDQVVFDVAASIKEGEKAAEAKKESAEESTLPAQDTPGASASPAPATANPGPVPTP